MNHVKRLAIRNGFIATTDPVRLVGKGGWILDGNVLNTVISKPYLNIMCMYIYIYTYIYIYIYIYVCICI